MLPAFEWKQTSGSNQSSFHFLIILPVNLMICDLESSGVQLVIKCWNILVKAIGISLIIHLSSNQRNVTKLKHEELLYIYR